MQCFQSGLTSPFVHLFTLVKIFKGSSDAADGWFRSTQPVEFIFSLWLSQGARINIWRAVSQLIGSSTAATLSLMASCLCMYTETIWPLQFWRHSVLRVCVTSFHAGAVARGSPCGHRRPREAGVCPGCRPAVPGFGPRHQKLIRPGRAVGSSAVRVRLASLSLPFRASDQQSSRA